MQKLAHMALALSFMVAPVRAADDPSAPLAPGKPSGVQQAQGFAPNYTVIFIGVLLLAGVGGIYLARTT